MIDIILTIIKNSLSITFFVLAMMLFIEYINVRTAGTFSKHIKKRGIRQILLGTVLGAIPGCLGAYTMVTLYTHNLVSIGALTAAFVATMGDEVFLLFSIQPKNALLIIGILFVIGFLTGIITDALSKNKSNTDTQHFQIHENEFQPTQSNYKTLIHNIRHASPHRAMLLFGLGIVLVLSLFGQIGHSHDLLSSFNIEDVSQQHLHHESCADNHQHHEINWLAITFVMLSLLIAYIVSIVHEHFLEEHFWNHIIRKHFFKILIWTTVVLGAVHILESYIHVEQFVHTYKYYLLLIAVLVGIIPESGPHIIFLSLYVSGAIPLSIFLANSIVQDGHGSLPLIAESKKAFIKIKLINMLVGLIVGFIALQFNI